MSNDIDTVKVVADTPFGYAIINAVDYDAGLHRLYAEPVESPPDMPYADGATAAPKRRKRTQ